MHPGYKIDAVYLCREPVDFRQAINGLSLTVEAEFGLSLFENSLYVFVNKPRDRIKVLYWDSNGFCLWQKRLEQDRLPWFMNGRADAYLATKQVTQRELEWLIGGVDLWGKKDTSKQRNKPCFTCVS